MGTITNDGHQWETGLRFAEGGSRTPSTIEVRHVGRKANPLDETVNEIIEVELFTLVFGVLSGIIVGSLLWYLGLA